LLGPIILTVAIIARLEIQDLSLSRITHSISNAVEMDCKFL